MKMNRTLVLAIASVLFLLSILLIPVQAAQAAGPILAMVLAVAWAGYFVWWATQKGWRLTTDGNPGRSCHPLVQRSTARCSGACRHSGIGV